MAILGRNVWLHVLLVSSGALLIRAQGEEAEGGANSTMADGDGVPMQQECTGPACACFNPVPLEGVDFTQCDALNYTCELPERDPNFQIGSNGGGKGCGGTCENTVPGAREALKQGATTLVVPVCLSKDNIPFVWHDCDMMSAEAITRSLGRFVNGRCVPFSHSSVKGKSAHEMTCADVKTKWGYSSDWRLCSRMDGVHVPTLLEYLEAMAEGNHFFVIHHTAYDPVVVRKLFYIAAQLAIRTGVIERVLFSVNSVELVGPAQCGIVKGGGLSRQISVYFSFKSSDLTGDVRGQLVGVQRGIAFQCAVPGAVRLPDGFVAIVNNAFEQLVLSAEAQAKDPVLLRKALERMQPLRGARRCQYAVFIVRPDLEKAGFKLMQMVLSQAMAIRDALYPTIHIFGSGIRKHKEMVWLMRNGADGFVTTDVTTASTTLATMEELDLVGIRNPVKSLGATPPSYIKGCVNPDGSPMLLDTMRKLFFCWDNLLMKWRDAFSAQATTPAPAETPAEAPAQEEG